MVDCNRNIKSGLFVLVLMIFFFSWLQREKDKHNETNQSVISNSYFSNHQAIVVPEIQSPGADLFWIKKLSKKFAFPVSDSGRELVLNGLISCCYNALQIGFHSHNPVIGFILPQKVPEQGNDDLPSIT